MPHPIPHALTVLKCIFKEFILVLLINDSSSKTRWSTVNVCINRMLQFGFTSIMIHVYVTFYWMFNIFLSILLENWSIETEIKPKLVYSCFYGGDRFSRQERKRWTSSFCLLQTFLLHLFFFCNILPVGSALIDRITRWRHHKSVIWF